FPDPWEWLKHTGDRSCSAPSVHIWPTLKSAHLSDYLLPATTESHDTPGPDSAGSATQPHPFQQLPFQYRSSLFHTEPRHRAPADARRHSGTAHDSGINPSPLQ